MHLKLFGKAFLAIAAFGLLALITFFAALVIFGGRYEARINKMNGEVVAYAEEESSQVFSSFAQKLLCDKTYLVAQHAEEFLEEHKMTVRELSQNQSFVASTTMDLGGGVFPAIVDAETRNIIAYPQPSSIGDNVLDAFSYSDGELENLRALFDTADMHDEASTIYGAKSANGEDLQKVACISWVPIHTGDDKQLYVFAATDRDNLGVTNNLLGATLRQKYGAAVAETMNALEQVKFMILVAFGLFLLFGLLVAWVFSRNISRPLVTLSLICERIASGHLDADIPTYKSRDEVSALAVSIARMQSNLAAQAELIDEKSREAENHAKELSEALMIAEERTKQLLSYTAKRE